MASNLFFISLFSTIIFIIVLFPLAIKVGLMDKPDHRKHHKHPTPLIGGLGIFLATSLTLLLNDLEIVNKVAFIAATGLLAGVGLVDDYKGLGVKIRLVAQIAAALIMTEVADLKINDLGDLLGTGNIDLGLFATLFTVFAVVGGINAFNMVDGIDGLAGSLMMVSLVTIAAASWLGGNIMLFNYTIIFIAAVLGFLFFNLRIFGRKNAAIFLGDTGSTLFGFIVCWLGIYAAQGEHQMFTPTTVLWLMAIPLLDSVSTMCRRMSKGRSPFSPDRQHLHHILALAGFSVNGKLIVIVASAAFLSAFGYVAGQYWGVPEKVLFFIFLDVFIAYYWCINHAWKVVEMTHAIGPHCPLKDRRVEDKRLGDRRAGDRRVGDRRADDRRTTDATKDDK
ncbi:MAG: undecaprenyl-phosphate alpha-N-acetylglucosaminyl 1-phosphate transferase [Methylococcaceae bacterium]|nr:undecaprenyl-phosphate alpha-N-acetylglucosaminyl 1-phosphate transferase [Methylococcaceae bacterium]